MNSSPLSELPLFPLGTVLFPQGVLPLRIFEVRYLDMIGRCWREGTPFGVVSLTQGHEVRRPDATERFHPVGTLARITDWRAPQPGLMEIRCEGTQRFRLQDSRQLKHGLWVGQAELLADDPAVPVPDDLQPVAQGLEQVLDKLRQQWEGDEARFPIPTPWRTQDCGWVANRWCELLPLPPETKQRLMELDSPLMRLELIGDLLSHGQG